MEFLRPARRHRFRLLLRLLFLLAAAGPLAAAGCSAPGTRGPSSPGIRFDHELLPSADEVDSAHLDLRIRDREIVPGYGGENLLRVRFSFVSYTSYPEDGTTLVSTGAVFFPVDSRGRARGGRDGRVALTEFPPGASRSGLSVQPEYGERPAVVLGIPAAVVDLRGPVVRILRDFENPYASDGAAFAGEDQFAYAMLHAYQRTNDPTLLHEHNVGLAWVRAMRAVDEIVRGETGAAAARFLLVGESHGAAGAVQAAAAEPRVDGLVMCGWPVDRADLHFTSWRRWERRARYYPLEALQPIPYGSSRDVLSFLFSSHTEPDPGCPSCRGSGRRYREQFDYLRVLRRGLLEDVAVLLLVGDEDPRFPIDLEARASARPEDLAAFPPRIEPGAPLPVGRAGVYGPFSSTSVPRPFRDLRYLRGSAGTLAHPDAVESVLAWIQHLGGYRDLPGVRVLEAVEGGDLRVEVAVREGNAAVTGVQVWLTEITDARDSDFGWPLHLARPEPMPWRRIDAIFAGPDADFSGRWRARLPLDPTRNRAYYVVVRDRVGDLGAAHSLPIRVLWNLGDPAAGPVRF